MHNQNGNHPLRDQIESLQQATHAEPFSVLGMHSNSDGSVIIRSWQPDADSVELIESARNRRLAYFNRVDESDLFECRMSNKLKNPYYRLRVTYKAAEFTPSNRTKASQSKGVIVDDAYQYQTQAYHAVHHVQSQPENIYQQLGAQPIVLPNGISAIRFAVFAPNAASCSLIGDFNQWDGRLSPMQKTQCGHFVLVMPNAKVGDRYKFELKDSQKNLLPHKSDPIGFYQDQYPSFASIVYDHAAYQWQDSKWMSRNGASHYQKPMSIYEVHLGSWLMEQDEAGSTSFLTYQQLIEKLIPYVLEMGYTHIEVLPVSEHPFTGSWGYQPTAMFAATSRFGDPDGFKAFVDACHQVELGVIIDWVPAHFPADAHGIGKFDGSSLYEYDDPKKGWHPDWNSYIYDFGKDSVRQFLVASALYWCDKFHVDGLRVDAVASMLYLDYSRQEGEWLPNIDGGNHNYEAISLLKWMNAEVHRQHPNVITVAEESTSFFGVSKPISEGGLGFDYKWNMGWMHDSLVYINKDPMYRSYHHRDITFSMVYHYDEHFVLPISHDEVVHGKGSMIRKMPGDEWQQAANLRAFAGYMYGHPGKKLNFMGNEFAQFEEWNHNISLSWHALQTPKHKAIQTLYKDLNKLYKETTALYQLDYHQGGFEWRDHKDAERSIIAFARIDAAGNEVVVVCNFTPIPRDDYQLGVKFATEYKVILNTDSEYYGGSNYNTGYDFLPKPQAHQGQAQSLVLNLPPLSVLYLSSSID